MDDLPLSEIRKPLVREKIVKSYQERAKRLAAKKKSGKLVVSLGGMEEERIDHRACLICQL